MIEDGLEWGVLWGDFADLVLDFGEVDKSIGWPNCINSLLIRK